jgi:polyphosphate glucokinase
MRSYPSAVAGRYGLGIDVGGTGVKAAVVDLVTGELVSKRVRVNTPKPSTPEAVAATIRAVVDTVTQQYPLEPDKPVGCGMPCVVKGGKTLTAANIDKKWIDAQADEIIGNALGRPVLVINDADAAAIAESRLGAGRHVPGTVLLLTIGTGIGSGLLVDGRLVPNTELGHLEFRGKDAEVTLSGAARERRRMRWKTWAQEFNAYLSRVELYLSPDLIIIGGGVSKVIDKYRDYLTARAPIVPAGFLNTSGIIGAALAAGDATDTGRQAILAVEAVRQAIADADDAAGPTPGPSSI